MTTKTDARVPHRVHHIEGLMTSSGDGTQTHHGSNSLECSTTSAHSYRSATIGSTRDARLAGR